MTKKKGWFVPEKVCQYTKQWSSLQLVIYQIFFWITKNNDNWQDFLPPSSHHGTISRRFHILNVTFRPVSSERRQHTSGHTDSPETIKPFSWKKAGLKKWTFNDIDTRVARITTQDEEFEDSDDVLKLCRATGHALAGEFQATVSWGYSYNVVWRTSEL